MEYWTGVGIDSIICIENGATVSLLISHLHRGILIIVTLQSRNIE